MKKWVALLLVLVMALGLMGCGKSANAKKAEEMIAAIGEVTLDSKAALEEAKAFYDSLTEDEKKEVENKAVLDEAMDKYAELEAVNDLTAEKWYNINDGDTYTLREDGTGDHEGTKLTYTRDGDTINIVEGSSSVKGRNFTWDRSGDVHRLIPDDENVYLVRERDYETVGKQVREENMKILTTPEFWKCTTQTGYYQFTQGGGGWLVLTGVTLGISWEMIDNNTVKVRMEYNGTSYSSTLDIFNENGSYKLVTVDGKATWIPKS